MIENHGACNNAACVAAEILKKGELLLGKLQLVPSAAGLAPNEIEFKIGDAQARCFRLIGRASPQEGAQPREDLGDSKRLGEVVVTTAFETQHTLIDRTPRGKNQDGRADTLSTQTMDEVQPIPVRQGEIDHHRVMHAFDGELFRLFGFRTGIDTEASLGERYGEKIANCVRRPRLLAAASDFFDFLLLNPDSPPGEFQCVLPKAFG